MNYREVHQFTGTALCLFAGCFWKVRAPPKILAVRRFLSTHVEQLLPGRRLLPPWGWGIKGSPPVGVSQQLLWLTFGPRSKRPALSGVNIKWWTFSSHAALYFGCQTDSRNTSAGADRYNTDACINDYEAVRCSQTVKRRLLLSLPLKEHSADVTGCVHPFLWQVTLLKLYVLSMKK